MTDDERRLQWTRLLIGTEPKPKGSGPRERGKYIGALDQAWVKKTFGQGDKPLTGTALSYWRKKGIPLEHVPTMIEALRSLLPNTQETAPAGAGAAETLLAMWTGTEPPPWSNTQVDRIIRAVESLRGEATEEAARQAVRAAGSELRKQIRAELTRGASGSPRTTQAKPTEQQP